MEMWPCMSCLWPCGQRVWPGALIFGIRGEACTPQQSPDDGALSRECGHLGGHQPARGQAIPCPGWPGAASACGPQNSTGFFGVQWEGPPSCCPRGMPPCPTNMPALLAELGQSRLGVFRRVSHMVTVRMTASARTEVGETETQSGCVQVRAQAPRTEAFCGEQWQM